jgi:hypothetical protein
MVRLCANFVSLCISNKQLRTTDERWSSSLEAGRRADHALSKKTYYVRSFRLAPVNTVMTVWIHKNDFLE